MRPQGRLGELFAAFSRICDTAFHDDRLLSCPNLSKAPNYGDVLRRWLLQEPLRSRSAAETLRSALRYCGANLGHLLFLAATALMLRLLGWKRPAKPAADAPPLFIIDTFALLPAIAADGAYQERYLPGLEDAACRAGHTVLPLYRLYGSRNPLTLWRALRVLSRQGGCTEAHLLTPADWLRLLRHTALYPFSLYRLISSLASAPENSPERYIREALLATSGQCILTGECRRLTGLRLNQHLALAAPGTRIVSWYENQIVNKAFQRGLYQGETQSGRHIPSIGAQLFLWPDSLLNNHHDPADDRHGLLPDKILVNGPHYLPEPPHERYTVGPSLRYSALFAKRPAQSLVPTEPVNRLLVLLSYHPEEIHRTLDLLRSARLDDSGNWVPIFKFHPASLPADYADRLPAAPLFAPPSLYDALQNAGAVIGSGSGALAEAAALGFPVLAVEDPAAIPGLSLNYLPALGKGLLWQRVTSADAIGSALAELAAVRNVPERPVLLRAFRRQLFTNPTPDAIRAAFVE